MVLIHLIPVVLITASLMVSQLKGYFLRPEHFTFFRVLFYLQQGLLASLILSGLTVLVTTRRLPRFLCIFGYFGAFAGFVWYGIWGFVRGHFGIEITASQVKSILTEPGAIGAAGFTMSGFLGMLILYFFVVAGMTAVTMVLARRFSRQPALRMAWIFGGLFLAVHLPVRAYFTYQINRDQYAVMALDDYVPFVLRSERLIPGLRKERLSLKNPEDPKRTEAWLRFASDPPSYEIPKKWNILWISIESFRFDAIDPFVMPRLWARRKQFQLRRETNHWSGGNATQYGIFAMLTGVSGYHFEKAMEADVPFPFVRLLSQNGYRIRFAKASYFNHRRLYRFVPPEALLVDAGTTPFHESDRRMIDLFLEDYRTRDRQKPSFDFITFDAPHWPYNFDPSDAPLETVPEEWMEIYGVKDTTELLEIRRRYRNSCWFVDGQVDRLLAALGRRVWDNTVVIITGDHGEEFQERGQLTHTGGMNDYQGRVPLWIHFPNGSHPRQPPWMPSTHLDLIPTLLQLMGFRKDILFTQGRSLLEPIESPVRPMLILAEQGNLSPLYHAFVTEEYVTRWWHTPDRFVFSGVQRRDGGAVADSLWVPEVMAHLEEASRMYEVLPDPSGPPRSFRIPEESVARQGPFE